MLSARVILSGIEMVHMMRKGPGSMPAIDNLLVRRSSTCSLHESVTSVRKFPALLQIATDPLRVIAAAKDVSHPDRKQTSC